MDPPPTASTSSAPPPPPNPAEGAPSAGLQSLRAYRARKSRPCDRCRKRKMRCVLLVQGSACLSCDLSSSACIYSDVVETSKPDRSQTTGAKPPSASRSGTPNKATQLTQSPKNGSAPQRPKSRPSTAGTPPQGGSGSGGLAPSAHLSAPFTLNYTLPPPTQPTGRTSLADLISTVSSTLGDARNLESAAVDSVDSGRALDLEANEDEEVYLVSTASERDALMLNLLAPPQRDTSVPKDSVPGLKLRHVSANTAFVYYQTKPYDSPTPGRASLDQLIQLIGPNVIDQIMASYIRIDGEALPIWDAAHFAASPQIDVGLQCAYVASGLTYHPNLRHLQPAAWSITYAHMRSHTPRARLGTVQAWLVDLNGRSQVNQAGNFVRLGSLIAVARLLGLHVDCSSWNLPRWERDLRTRLWWALVQYDRISALAFGRPSLIGYEDQDLPKLPMRPLHAAPNPSHDAFLALCELTVILDSLNRRLSLQGAAKMTALEEIGLRLDQWRQDADRRGLFSFGPDQAPPGVRSLQLVYHYSAMILARETWDCVAQETPAADAIGQRSCLLVTLELVDFVTSLRPSDLQGYWSSHSTYFLSTCLTTLVRLTVSSDRSDQSSEAIWQSSLFALRRFISALADAKQAGWDVASLTYSRATFFTPLLAARAPEFGVVLEPLQRMMPATAPLDDDLERFLASFTSEPYSGLFDPNMNYNT